MVRETYTIFYLGPIPIQVWGFFVALGMVLTFLIILKRGKKLGFDVEKILDLGILMLISGFVFARLFHVFFYNLNYFIENPIDIIKIWEGGLSSFGGFFGAILVFFIFVKKDKYIKEKLLNIADLFAFSALYGWMLGRVGCVMIHDHPGRLYNSIFSYNSEKGLRLDMAVLEILGLIPLAILFFVNKNKKIPDGWYLYIMFVYYGVLRFILDFFRADDVLQADARYLGLTPAQYFAIVLFAIGVRFLRKNKR
jgi:phosphatidylglycerol:prolipoprotein diacylglycerol transferase